MAARKRALAATDTSTAKSVCTDTKTDHKPQETTDSPIAPPKSAFIFKLSLLLLAPYFYLLFYYHYKIQHDLKRSILINAVLSLAGFFLTVKMIPVASRYVLRRNLFGYDINKKGTPQGTVKVPESLGIVVGIVFLVLAILFQYFNFTADSIWLVEYNAALACICFMTLLGFVDDVLDVPWRVKLLLPSIAALPLLMAYAGHTTIIIPKPLIPYVGHEILDLGPCIFCLSYLNLTGHLHGFTFFQLVSSSVFVGDTYTYFAGMTMAVVGILGHFSFLAMSIAHGIGCLGLILRQDC
ncbi:hypothetical protein GH714_035229 [Hevea brasiliensis]|uniref:UDP-N-acetylglucosamine--dolichyl-phosphate N-acetylglucosaminephosphotransferase n=1 Tax=Hevea brasiliensis TaxID=3981 RepID=A0A6A6KK70_HEVBR|nr:hypothetical protein GH714_035229 [Hevea brasiliensis]